jgi:hypothetical protein
MMSKLVTPPDVINEDIVYLLVNPTIVDIEMVTKYLQINNKDFTIHLYFDGMNDHAWLNTTANISSSVLVNRANTSIESITTLLDSVNKLIWIGKDQKYDSAMEYLYKNA